MNYFSIEQMSLGDYLNLHEIKKQNQKEMTLILHNKQKIPLFSTTEFLSLYKAKTEQKNHQLFQLAFWGQDLCLA